MGAGMWGRRVGAWLLGLLLLLVVVVPGNVSLFSHRHRPAIKFPAGLSVTCHTLFNCPRVTTVQSAELHLKVFKCGIFSFVDLPSFRANMFGLIIACSLSASDGLMMGRWRV